MNIVQNEYLLHLDKELKPLPMPVKKSIIARAESHLSEICFSKNCTVSEALTLIDNPQKLILGYLKEEITRTPKVSITKIRSVFVYCYLSGIVGLVTRPLIAVLAAILVVSGFGIAFLGLLNIGTYMMAETQGGTPLLGVLGVNQLLSLLLSLFMGALFFGGGLSAWKSIRNHLDTFPLKNNPIVGMIKEKTLQAQKRTSKRSMISINAAEINENEA